MKTTLRDDQRDALAAWLERGKGTVVYPPGSGKTLIGIAAIAKLGIRPIIIVPTIDQSAETPFSFLVSEKHGI